MKRPFPNSLFVFVLLLVSSCATRLALEMPENSYESGFISGIWHGFIAPFSLIGMLFDSEIAVFATNNSGFFYALGFLIGSGGWGILASKAKKSKD